MGADKTEFYQKIYECNPNHETITHMVIEGDAIGEKAVCSNGKLVWTSEKNGFMKRCEPYITRIKGSGMNIVEGKQVYSEVIGHEKKLVICGAGHVSMPIIQIGRMIGFSVTVIEDREIFADNARRQGADNVICDTFANGLAQIPSDDDTYFVIVTRAHRWDRECLRIISGKPHAYVGMMGSKRRVSLVLNELRKEGIPEEFLGSVCTPIGLKIGAETPEEIAVSVMAQIIEIKNWDKRAFAYTREMMDAILGLRHSEVGGLRKVMATIIKRKGSAPRDVGTKMLIMEDGTCIGTIGGGYAEAVIAEEGRKMFREEPQPKVLEVSLHADLAEEEGMICGGELEVFMDPLY
jgi:xanthine dehydrogenase accessory factor